MFIVTASSDEDREREEELIRALCARRAAGLIVVSSPTDLFARLQGDRSPPLLIELPTRLIVRGSGEIRPA